MKKLLFLIAIFLLGVRIMRCQEYTPAYCRTCINFEGACAVCPRISSSTTVPIPQGATIGIPVSTQFSCPNVSAGCASYEGLLGAHDKSLDSSSVYYACFLDYEDYFFVIGGHFWGWLRPQKFWIWNKRTAQYDFNLKAHDDGDVYITTYRDGVEDSSSMPSTYLDGQWMTLFFDTNLNFFGSDGSASHLTAMAIDDSRVSFNETYQAQNGHKVEYSLKVQQSTGRFKESFNVIGSPKDNFERTGNCVAVNPIPKPPEPPSLTMEQQDEKAKLDYCADNSKEDRGYCASSFTYLEDYRAAQKKRISPKK